MITSITETISGVLTPQAIRVGIRIFIIIFVGYPVLKIMSRVLGKSIGRRKHSLQTEMLVKKSIVYIGGVLLFFFLLNELGFQVSVLLGALGIFGVAIGFASQTSVSNIISGIFVITERPFEIGDVVQVGSTIGVVLSIDLLSAKLRTFDNRFVRIPNETIIKTEMTNITRFPIRRLDLDIGVAYKENIRRVIEVLRDVAAKNKYCLEEPAPVIFTNKFGDSSINIRYALWFEKSDIINLIGSIMLDIKERFDAEDIEIPFPHVTLYTGEETKPMPIDLSSLKEELKSS